MTTNKSFVTRESAMILTWHRSVRSATKAAEVAGYEVSKSTLSRFENTPWHAVFGLNDGIVQFTAHEMAHELAETYGYRFQNRDIDDVMDWLSLNHRDPALRAAATEDKIWQDDARFANAVLDKVSTNTPINRVVRASAGLHLARNPQLPAQTRNEWLNKAIVHLDAFVEQYGEDYWADSVFEFLDSREDFLVHPACDMGGVLVSTALHLRNQAYASVNETAWRDQITSLEKSRLLPQMAVRGIFFREPESLVNTAEVLWLLEAYKEANALIDAARQFEPDLNKWITGQWSMYLKPEFVCFAESN